MTPPLVKGRALLRRRLAGIAFLVVLAFLVQLSVWLYQKKFTDVTHVSLQANRVGNQLSVHADVKLRGLIVGEVRSVRSEGQGATLDLAIEPSKADHIPTNVHAVLLPKTLFGEKEVVLVLPDDPASDTLEDGDVISQDRSRTAIETETALNDLLPRLEALHPQDLSAALNALSKALRGNGDKIGNNMVMAAAYLRRLNPELPAVGDDLERLAALSETLADVSPDLLRTLDNLSFSSRSLVDDRAALDRWLTSTRSLATTAREITDRSDEALIALANDSKPVAQLFASRSEMFPCFLKRVVALQVEAEKVFSNRGLHITIEATQDHGGYAPGDEPQYKELRFFPCFGLGPTPIRPFPEYANPDDGYRDGTPPEDPNEGPGGCCDAAWSPAVAPAGTTAPTRRSTPMPGTPTPLEALLLAPLTG
jgi:virulence factor Mce-like protein